MRIGVFGHYGNANLGDEAIIRAAIENLRGRLTETDIVCFSINEADSAQRYDVPAYPIRRLQREAVAFELSGEPPVPEGWFDRNRRSPAPRSTDGTGLRERLKRVKWLRTLVLRLRQGARGIAQLPGELRFLYRSFQVLKSLDLLMVTGSNQFLDNFGGVWGFPYTVFKWVALARLAGCKVALVSLGAGPLKHPVSHRLCRWSLALAHHASYRDEPSRELVEGSPPHKGLVYPDVASNVSLPDPVQRDEQRPLCVGINPMPVFDARYWHAGDDRQYSAYVDKLVGLTRHVQSNGYLACLFSTQIKDNAVIGDVLSRLTDEERDAVVVRQPRTVDELLATLRDIDISVPTRFHGTVLSVRVGNPTLGICYHRKTGDLLTAIGLGEYQVDFTTFTLDEIIALLDRLIANRETVRPIVQRANQQHEQLLSEQYDRIVGLLDD
ncbi:MAG: polysaccharide pyruvyl transferase family protein [Pseudomonadota bacterium]